MTEVKQFTLRRSNETKIVRTPEEARDALVDGFLPTTLESELQMSKSWGVVIPLDVETKLVTIDDDSSKNKNRELIYLSSGLNSWFENVNNYWHNHHRDTGRAFISRESALTGLDKQLLQHIKDGASRILHQDPKDMGVYGIDLNRFNEQVLKSSNIPREFCVDAQGFLDSVLFEIGYKCSGSLNWRDGNLPDRLQPKKNSVNDNHPLIAPFRGTLEQLKTQGIEELPDWLVAQGRMAGVSAVYQNIPIQLKSWIEKAVRLRDVYNSFVNNSGIQNAPSLFLPTDYAEDLCIVDKQIHRRTI
jgi:hypothetical protein